ncbi:MAG: glycosyltransferase family 4 protein [Puniceicoccaceae bacterium]|nr:MAG: glycosyltransferase family 4 protein [Puniceicoccaceae bacterium]
MKILYATSVFPRWPGDATPPFVRNQAELMAANGYTIRVLVPHAKGALIYEESEGISVRRYRYMWPSGAQQLCYDGGMLIRLKAKPWTALLLPFLILAQAFHLLAECLIWKPDLIHSHSLLPQGLVAIIAGRLFGIPHICTSHGNDVFGLSKDGAMGLLKRQVLRHADAITVNSSATLKAVLEQGASIEKVHQIPAVANRVEVNADLLEAINQKFGDAPRILFVGRFIEQKGVLDLLEAFSRVIKQVDSAKCLFVGDGVLRSQMEAMANELGIAQSVEFIGWRPGDEIATWMAAAEVLVVPSKLVGTWQEAQGLVVVEAMSTGTPVIASRMGGIVDMVDEGVTGRLFTPGDTKHLASLLVGILANPLEGERMAAAAQVKVAEHFAPDVVARQTERLYKYCIQR